jgi:hypothetical protein
MTDITDPTLEDFDPKFNLLAIADWLLRAANYADFALKNHPQKIEFCDEMRFGALSIGNANGQMVGAIQALSPVCQLIDQAKIRQDSIRQQYVEFRSQVIDQTCLYYFKALSMRKEVNIGPGKPRRKIPDFEQFKKTGDMRKVRGFVQYSWEFKLAVDLAEAKHLTGKYTGLNKMMEEAIEAGHIDDIGDTAQRIKRHARQLHSERNLYLTPGLREARATASQFKYSEQ